MKIFISHGRNGSTKDDIVQILADCSAQKGLDIVLVDDSDIQNEPEQRAQRLIKRINELALDENVILAGFSMGGYASLRAAEVCRAVRGAFLIAPALYMPHYGLHRWKSDLINVEIIHGWSDDVVIYEHSLRFARELNAVLHLIPGGHLLPSQSTRIREIFSSYLVKFLD